MPVRAGGHSSFLQLAKESTYGTAPAAATAKYETTDFDFDANQSTLEDPSVSTLGMFPRAVEQGVQFATQKFGVRVGFEGFEEIWRMLLPTYSSAVTDTTARDHTFKEGV